MDQTFGPSRRRSEIMTMTPDEARRFWQIRNLWQMYFDDMLPGQSGTGQRDSDIELLDKVLDADPAGRRYRDTIAHQFPRQGAPAEVASVGPQPTGFRCPHAQHAS